MDADRMAAIIESMPSLQFDTESVSRQDLLAICEATLEGKSARFSAPSGASHIVLKEAIDLLSLVAQYIAIGVTIWSKTRKAGDAPESGNEAQRLDATIIEATPGLSKVPEQIRDEASTAISKEKEA